MSETVAAFLNRHGIGKHLAVRIRNAATNMGIQTMPELLAANRAHFERSRNLGEQSIAALDRALLAAGLDWR